MAAVKLEPRITVPTATSAPRSTPQAVAPLWHTVVILLFFLAVSALGATTDHLPFFSGENGRARGYLLAIGLEWAPLGFVAVGLRRRGFRLAFLIGPIKPGIPRWLLDAAIAVGFMVTANMILHLFSRLLPQPSDDQALRNLLPRGTLQTVLYLLLCLSAGFCEEIIFRGYLQRQFAAFTGSANIALVLQGIAFGAGHGYQGLVRMTVIAVFGCMFGLLARWRGSLRPGMIAHFMQDSIAGIVLSRTLK